jgi:hypothetical protein
MKSPGKSGEDGAKTLVAVWQRAHDALEVERQRNLRQLSEQGSAQCFARLLRLSTPYPLRESSGLVEQQRVFARLRNQT